MTDLEAAWRLVIREWFDSPLVRARELTRLSKLARLGPAALERARDLMDHDWAWRICAANLCLGNLDWWGWECRSEVIWKLCHVPYQYPRWNGFRCRLYLVAEQGIGDEIVFSNAYHDLHALNPSTTVECDSRLIPAFERTFPGLRFETRWRGAVGDQRPLVDWRGPYDAFMPCGNALKLCRTRMDQFTGPWIVMDESQVADWRVWLDQYPRPWVGVSWTGRQGRLEPSVLRDDGGTLFNLNYDGTLGFVKPGFRDFDDMWHFVAALDRVDSITNTTVHMSGSVGVPTNVIRPQPSYGDVNNRLPWQFGKLCKFLYPSTTVHQSEKAYATAKTTSDSGVTAQRHGEARAAASNR